MLNKRGSIALEALITFPVFIASIVIFSYCLKFYYINECLDEILYETAQEFMFSFEIENEINNLVEKKIVFEYLIKKNKEEIKFLNKLNGTIKPIYDKSARRYLLELSTEYTIPFYGKVNILKKYVVNNFNIPNLSKKVYITKTGKKYHYIGCINLRKSMISIELNDAINRGYTPCKECVGGMNYFK